MSFVLRGNENNSRDGVSCLTHVMFGRFCEKSLTLERRLCMFGGFLICHFVIESTWSSESINSVWSQRQFVSYPCFASLFWCNNTGFAVVEPCNDYFIPSRWPHYCQTLLQIPEFTEDKLTKLCKFSIKCKTWLFFYLFEFKKDGDILLMIHMSNLYIWALSEHHSGSFTTMSGERSQTPLKNHSFLGIT